ncbi:Transcriptional repressor CcpN [compost metagenome]
MPVSMVMTRQPKVITVSPEDTVLDAANKMIFHEVDSLPVVVTGGAEETVPRLDVVGRLTKTSIVKLLLDLEAKG